MFIYTKIKWDLIRPSYPDCCVCVFMFILICENKNIPCADSRLKNQEAVGRYQLFNSEDSYQVTLKWE